MEMRLCSILLSAKSPIDVVAEVFRHQRHRLNKNSEHFLR
ncbi:hypothetical protein BVRB_3g053420 isoform B [Beta vulgaris subsp. vulgaris]|nr:hypothetical protein BVRB_3g053420 isoform B [Beta vulgaris subsp. vulgaris]